MTWRKSEKQYTIRANGVEIKGTEKTVCDTLKKMGLNPKDYGFRVYWSESKREWVNLADMATPYLRNAITKRYQEWLTSLKYVSNVTFLEKLENGPEELLPLVEELARRKD